MISEQKDVFVFRSRLSLGASFYAVIDFIYYTRDGKRRLGGCEIFI